MGGSSPRPYTGMTKKVTHTIYRVRCITFGRNCQGIWGLYVILGLLTILFIMTKIRGGGGGLGERVTILLGLLRRLYTGRKVLTTKGTGNSFIIYLSGLMFFGNGGGKVPCFLTGSFCCTSLCRLLLTRFSYRWGFSFLCLGDSSSFAWTMDTPASIATLPPIVLPGFVRSLGKGS